MVHAKIPVRVKMHQGFNHDIVFGDNHIIYNCNDMFCWSDMIFIFYLYVQL